MVGAPRRLGKAVHDVTTGGGLHTRRVLRVFLFRHVLRHLTGSTCGGGFVLGNNLLVSSVVKVKRHAAVSVSAAIHNVRVRRSRVMGTIGRVLTMSIRSNVRFTCRDVRPVHRSSTCRGFHIRLHTGCNGVSDPVGVSIAANSVVAPTTVRCSFPVLFSRGAMPIVTCALRAILTRGCRAVVHEGVNAAETESCCSLRALFHHHESRIHSSVLGTTILRATGGHSSIRSVRS